MAVVRAHRQASAIKSLRDRLESSDPELAALVEEADTLCLLRRITLDEKSPFSIINVNRVESHGIIVTVGERVYVVPAPYIKTRV